jgi:hypothetical protein
MAWNMGEAACRAPHKEVHVVTTLANVISVARSFKSGHVRSLLGSSNVPWMCMSLFQIHP